MTVIAPTILHRGTVSPLPSGLRPCDDPTIGKVWVIDGDAISPMVASFLAGANDYVMFASSQDADTYQLSQLLKVYRAEIWEAPFSEQSADMRLACYVGNAIAAEPALCKARWLLVSSDKNFRMLRPLLVAEGVNENCILNIKPEIIKQAGDRVLLRS